MAERCDGYTRRDLLRVGGLTALGFGLGDFLRWRDLSAAEGQAKANPAKAKSCILIWLDGGPSHFETFDPKADAPEEVRGPLSTVPTKTPGIHFSECLTETAKRSNDIAVIRSMTSTLGEHNFGTHYLMTGYKPTPAVEYPTYGSALAHLRPSDAVLPPNIAIPKLKAVTGNGFLPATARPFALGGDPGRSNFRVRDLDFYRGIDLSRVDRRRSIVQALDDFSREKDASRNTGSDPNLERAYRLLASTEAKQAFELSQESDQTRNRYGRSGSLGASCLLARRLVERGVPFVTVNHSGWDTHTDIIKLKTRYRGDRNAHVPSLDRAFSALIDDLRERALLDSTLVLVMGEFGRTPKINTNGGRDHWPNVFSVALAGGGVQGGQVVGSSDALGELPKDRPVSPSDLAATIYTLLGVDPARELKTSDGRPIRLTPDGSKVIPELVS
ncbi:MAG: DUF1501 domain-containing protein [Planctomycetota bacterium]